MARQAPTKGQVALPARVGWPAAAQAPLPPAASKSGRGRGWSGDGAPARTGASASRKETSMSVSQRAAPAASPLESADPGNLPAGGAW